MYPIISRMLRHCADGQPSPGRGRLRLDSVRSHCQMNWYELNHLIYDNAVLLYSFYLII